jgi:hypothetical protein
MSLIHAASDNEDVALWLNSVNPSERPRLKPGAIVGTSLLAIEQSPAQES